MKGEIKMLTKEIVIDGKNVKFKASAAIPRLYRIKFRRDIIKDLQKLEKTTKLIKTGKKEEYEIGDLEVFENVAYMFAKHADPSGVPDTIEDWLDEFQTFSIYLILPQILELWGFNQMQMAESKKKIRELTRN